MTDAQPAIRPRFDPVLRRTVSEEIRDALAQGIRDGAMLPGSRIPSERDLCEEFGVARTSVREAIQGLVSLGVIERRGNRTYVAEHLPDVGLDRGLDGEDRRKRLVHELFEVRRVVEVPIAKLAAERATPEERCAIRDAAQLFKPTMPLHEFRAADRTFHWALARSCGNEALAELYGKVLDTLFRSQEFDSLLSDQSNSRAVRQIIRDATRAHRAIAEAVVAGDVKGVEAAAHEHLAQVEDHMTDRLV